MALMKHLDIQKADFFGESFGGIVATIIAVRHPELVSRVATYGSIFSKPQDAVKQEVLATQLSLTPDAKGIQFQRENYKKVAPDPDYWPTIWSKVGQAQFTLHCSCCPTRTAGEHEGSASNRTRPSRRSGLRCKSPTGRR
jgi:pimeloyl-ACP methyl ester carboxylesterase